MRRVTGTWLASIVTLGCVAVLATARPAAAQDTTAPVLNTATRSPASDGNGNWYRKTPVTVTLSATDDVGVSRLRYSLDGGATSQEAPITPGTSVTATVQVTAQGITSLRYWATDAAGNASVGDRATAGVPGAAGGRGGAQASTTLSVAGAAGANGIRLSSTAGRSVGEKLVLGIGADQETVTIARIVADPVPDAPAPNVMLDAPLKKAHPIPAHEAVFLTYRSVSVQIDSMAPVANWPAIKEDRIMQSETLTPALSDPRRQNAADTANGSGGTAIWRMEMDGTHVYPFPQPMNRLPVGKHSHTLSLQDAAGNSVIYKRTFLVTTSFSDLETVLTQYADNALKTTLGAAAGDKGLRLTSPLGYRVGQTLVIGAGADEESVTIERVPSPPPQQGHNIFVGTALVRAHEAGAATPVSNPRPFISGATGRSLKALLEQATDQAAAGQKTVAAATLGRFNVAVAAQVAAAEKTVEREALTSAGKALIDELHGKTVVAGGLGLMGIPGVPIIRVFTDPTVPVKNPNATYKVLVNGQTFGFRHEHIPDTEAMIQKLGLANGFDVEIWHKPGSLSPGRPLPPGVSLETSPFLDLEKLKEYKTTVFDSSVGRDNQASLNPTEFAIFQEYMRQGGGFVAIHGGVDAYQNVPWYVDLVGGGFSGHGGNAAGIMPECGSCGEVELIVDDPDHPATEHLPERFPIHDELYNTSRNPVELGIVHPLVLQNPATIIGQINYNTGPTMNSDRQGMIWCRDYEGGRSFVTVLGHSWQPTHEPWYQQMILKAIQTTSGVVRCNCVTYVDVSELIDSTATAGGINAAGKTALSATLTKARALCDKGRYTATLPILATFLTQAANQEFCRNAQGSCPEKGAALARIRAKGQALVDWMKGGR